MVMPSSDENTLVLKLPSGYNIGIHRKNITAMNTVKSFQGGDNACTATLDQKNMRSPAGMKRGLPTISILHTGGTIASEVDYGTGGVVARFTPEEIVAMFPELKDIANIRSKLIVNMFSEDMRFAHYNIMAKEVAKEVKEGSDGVIITHGTDTLGCSAAALSFALEHIGIPVLLVGAQRSSDRGSSDAALNLLCAAQFIAHSDFAGVGICMHESVEDSTCVILPACKTRKMHTSRRDAFKAVNGTPLARVDSKGNIVVLHHGHESRDKHKKVRLRLFKEHLKIGLLKVHPTMYAEEVKKYASFHGLVVEGTGLGHMPVTVVDAHTAEHKRIMAAITELAKKMPVVMAAQTVYGRLQMHVYSPGRRLTEAGVIGNYSDMLSETAFIKLAWVLSNYPKKDVARLMMENLRGELSVRSLYEETRDA